MTKLNEIKQINQKPIIYPDHQQFSAKPKRIGGGEGGRGGGRLRSLRLQIAERDKKRIKRKMFVCVSGSQGFRSILSLGCLFAARTCMMERSSASAVSAIHRQPFL